MCPILFHLGPLAVSSYGVSLAIAFLLVIGLTARATARDLNGRVPMSPEDLADWGTWVMGGGILGGRVLYVALNWDAYAQAPFEIVALWHGGLIWYGGFLGGVLANLIYCRRRGYSALRAFDQVLPFAVLGHAIGRIGCFLNGCCAGVPTRAWWGVWLPNQPEPLVPIQLFESLGLVLLYVVLRRVQRSRQLRRPGVVLGAYLIGYGLVRWLVEYGRANQPLLMSGLTLHQLLSAIAMAVGLMLIVRAKPISSRG